MNPRTAHHRYTISSRAPSTTQPTLHMVAEEGFEPSQTESESVVLPLHNSAIWLPKKDSNPHKQSQSLSCYPYTIRQYGCRRRIRTLTNRVRVCRATLTQFGNVFCCVSFLANQRILLYSCWGRMSRKNPKKFMKNLHKKREILMNLRMEKA